MRMAKEIRIILTSSAKPVEGAARDTIYTTKDWHSYSNEYSYYEPTNIPITGTGNNNLAGECTAIVQ